MKIDRKTVREQFAAYTRNYDPTNPKIALKIAHTYRVADNCEKIAMSLNMADEDVEFAWLSGMLHDIGRFEQVKRYNTFIDSESVDHAEFGADLLFEGERLITEYVDFREWDSQLETVIRQHNKYRMDESISGKTLVFCNILRDADKVDILRVNVETPMEEIYNVTEDVLFSAGVSEKVMEQVREHHAVNRDIMDSPAEHLIGHIALAFELVYPKSWELARKQGYLYKMFDFPTRNESTKNALVESKTELESFYFFKQVTIRDLDESYFEKIKELFRSVFTAPPWNEEWSEDQLDNYIRELIEVRQPILYGLFDNDELIGMSIGRVKHWCGGTEYFIEEYCIRSDYQGKGCGRKFFSLIEEKIKARGLNTIFLMTERTQPAYEFYKHIGFTELPELTSFAKELGGRS